MNFIKIYVLKFEIYTAVVRVFIPIVFFIVKKSYFKPIFTYYIITATTSTQQPRVLQLQSSF